MIKYLTVAWVEEGTFPELTEKVKYLPGCRHKGCENNFRFHVESFVSTLPLIFWKMSSGESSRFAHQETVKAKANGKPVNYICGAKCRHDITLWGFIVFFGILLQMCIFQLLDHSYVL
jgi:hypothetical protein